MSLFRSVSGKPTCQPAWLRLMVPRTNGRVLAIRLTSRRSEKATFSDSLRELKFISRREGFHRLQCKTLYSYDNSLQ